MLLLLLLQLLRLLLRRLLRLLLQLREIERCVGKKPSRIMNPPAFATRHNNVNLHRSLMLCAMFATDGRIAYQREYLGGVKTDVFPNENGDVLAQALGDKDILLLANHGCIVAGRSIAQAMEDLYYLERAAMNQIIAMSTGSPLRLVPPTVLGAFQAAAQEPRGKADYADVFLAAWIAELCESELDFARLDGSPLVHSRAKAARL